MKIFHSSFVAWLIVVTAIVSAHAGERSGKVVCGAIHSPRNHAGGGSELLDSTVTVRNGNIVSPADARITRLTYFDMFGTVIHDSGEDSATAAPLPRNFDVPVPGGQDITLVPPGASHYITTSHIFGQGFLPGPAARGNSMAVVVEFKTDGDPDLVIVSSSFRGREWFGPGSVGEERTRIGFPCRELK